MSENEYNEYEDDDEQEQRPNPVRAQLRKLEKEAAELRKQNAEAAQLRRELAFIKAGINPDDPKAKYFVKGYDGDLSTEAIVSAATEAQLIAPQSTATPDDRAGWNTTNRIAAGAETAPDGPSWIDRISKAQSESELMAIFAEAQAQGIDLGSN
jgi:ribosomal protein L12E/L44/L45/RPP1/RPP2